MPTQFRRHHWSRQIDEVIRSKHYTWLGLGLGGHPVDEAMVELTAKIMHICRRSGLDWQRILDDSRARVEREEREVTKSAA